MTENESGDKEDYCTYLLKNFSSTSKLWLEGYKISNRSSSKNKLATLNSIFDKSLINGLQQFKKKYNISIFILFHAAWGILLNRFSGTDDIFYGTYDIVGGKLLPVRASVHVQEDILTYILNLLKQFKQTRENADLLYNTLQNNKDFHDLFNHVLTCTNEKDSSYEVNIATFSVNLIIKDEEQLEFTYNTEKLTKESILNLTTHFLTILKKMIEDPRQSVTHFSILTPDENHKLLKEWNKSAYKMPEDKITECIHDLVAIQAEKAPENIALNYKDININYKKLNILTNKLARFLKQNGIVSGNRVAVSLERSPAVIVTMLAIFKVGAIFVPINPKYPEERIKYVLSNCEADLIIATNTNGIAAEFLDKVIYLDDNYSILQFIDDQPITDKIPVENVAYVIYTSGTTGYPKGVMIKHSSLINLSNWYKFFFSVNEKDCASQFASPGFDSFFCETIPFLAVGASIHIIDDSQKLIPTEFLAWLVKQKITICDLPTAYAQVIFNIPCPANLSVRHFKLGGESLTHYPAQIFPFNIWNAYGPTEATVETTFILIYEANTPVKDVTTLHMPPPIGKPMANAEVYVVDPHLVLVPIGNVGELLIGGLGLSVGYLNRLQLTNERFIRNHFSDDPDAKLYRTGDLVRWLDDGNLEFVGRVDHQVKIRGYRIELNEIKSIIEQYPDIGEAVVLLKELANGQKTIVTYLVENLDKLRIPYHERCLGSSANIEFFEVITDDISKEGIAISEFNQTFKVGESLQLNLKLPGLDESQWLKGFVVWQNDNRVGVKFDDIPQQRKLIASSIEYYLSEHNLMETLQSAVTKRNIRKALQKKLPEYMLPSIFTVLPQFPLTFNGKIDWKALPPPRDFERLLEQDYVAPRTETEIIIADIWKEILDLKRISINDSFFDIGGNSILVSQLSIKLLEKFNISVPVKILFDLPFIPIIAEYINSNGKSYTDKSLIQEEINHDSILDENITPTKILNKNLKNPKSILLTGAGGFLGVFLLKEFLQKTEAIIYCLVRKKEHKHAVNRLIEDIERYNLSNEISLKNRRIIVIDSDLSQHQFGLSSKQYNNLASEIDMICHCAAQVNTMASYSVLRDSNVLGTLEIIKFATHKVDKPIHYISSLSAAYKQDKEGKLVEDFPDANSSQLIGGYAISKWVAERLLTDIKNRGLPVIIYRCGNILGQSETGVTNLNDAILYLLKGCIQLGFAPNWTEKFFFLPVNFVSEVVTRLLLHYPTQSQVYHIDHPTGIKWVDLIAWLNHYGYTIQLCTQQEWQAKLMHITPENALFSLIPQYLAKDDQAVIPEVSMKNLLIAFKSLGMTHPDIDDVLLSNYIKFLCRMGFISKPQLIKA